MAPQFATEKTEACSYLIEILVADDYEMMRVISHASFTGHAATKIANGFLNILSNQSPDTIPKFIIKIFRDKIDYYGKLLIILDSQGQNISKILQEDWFFGVNGSIAVWLLVQFQKREAQAFVRDALSETVKMSTSALVNCEIDPSRIRNASPNITEQGLNEIIARNRENLKNCFSTVLASILGSGSQFPKKLATIYRFITSYRPSHHLVRANSSDSLYPLEDVFEQANELEYLNSLYRATQNNVKEPLEFTNSERLLIFFIFNRFIVPGIYQK
jgi:hypothetical protein